MEPAHPAAKKFTEYGNDKAGIFSVYSKNGFGNSHWRLFYRREGFATKVYPCRPAKKVSGQHKTVI